jgi:uroporphyrinogen-III decarboxylase
MAFSDWLYANTDATHRIALERLVAMVARYLQTQGMGKADAEALLASDYSGGAKPKQPEATPAPKRQARRLAA